MNSETFVGRTVSTPRMWEIKDGGRRLLRRTGALCQAIFQESKGQSGKPCVIDTTSGEHKKVRVLWELKEAKDRRLDFCDASH